MLNLSGSPEDWKAARKRKRDNALRDRVESLEARVAALEARDAPEPDLSEYAKLPELGGGDEPIPDALARLVPQNMELAAQKQWAASRWIALNAQRLDMARPLAQRSFEDLTTAEAAELAALDAYAGWFG